MRDSPDDVAVLAAADFETLGFIDARQRFPTAAFLF